MSEKPPSARELGVAMTVAQVGLEMVAPIAVGYGLDVWLDIGPWGIVVGAVIGLIGGVCHLAWMQDRQTLEDNPRQGRK